MLSLVARCGGTISAEHGIGRHKPAYLHLVRSDAELAAMRAGAPIRLTIAFPLG